jgi:hypothetical protein
MKKVIAAALVVLAVTLGARHLGHALPILGAHAPTSKASGPGPVTGQGPGHYTVQRFPAPGTCHVRMRSAGNPLPDAHCTPGATNPAVSQANLASTICRAGYTTSIRPGTSITNPEKQASARSYGYTGPFGAAEFDHLVSLELGGSPNDPRNLWIEPQSSGFTAAGFTLNPKDKVEHALNKAVCGGRVSLTAAQHAIATDWTTALTSLHVQ